MSTPAVNASKRRRTIVGVGVGALLVAAATIATVGRAGAGEVTSDGWTTSATASSAVATPGSSITFEISVEGDRSGAALVDFELYDAQSNQVHQEFWDDVSFRAGTVRTFEVTWKVPSTSRGALRARLGVFSTGWGELLHWNDELVVVGTPRAASAPAPRPATTVPTPTTDAPTTTAAPATTAPPAATPEATTAPRGTTEPAVTEPATTSASSNGAVQFSATFETAADFYDRFQLGVHFRGVEMGSGDEVLWDKGFSGDHDMSCGGPASQREIHAHPEIDGANTDLEKSELFWWCAPGGDAAKGHVMTGMGDIDGYSIIAFSPDQMFTDAERVCWDVNLTDLGPRKWTSVGVIPEKAYQDNDRRLDYVSPGTREIDETVLDIPDGSFMYRNDDHAFRLFNPEEVLVDGEQFSTSDKAYRYEHCLVDNGDGTVTMSQERDGGVVHRKTVDGSFPDEARVIFMDDNYTPDKDGLPAGYTWHWDNIIVS